MAYKEQLNRCLAIMNDFNAPEEMMTQFKGVLKLYEKRPTENDVILEFENSCVKHNFTSWLEKGPWFVRKRDDFPETGNEEICYRRGFDQGMAEMGRILGISEEEILEKSKSYHAWRKSKIFQIRTRPGCTEKDDVRNRIKEYKGKSKGLS